MATYTPNINLKKPTTSEYYNVLDENSNKDKIDTAFGKQNTNSGYESITSVSSQSALDSALDSALSAMDTNSVKRLRVSTTAAFGLFASSEVYFVDLQKGASATYAAGIISRNASEQIIKVTKGSSGWKYVLINGGIDLGTVATLSDLGNAIDPYLSATANNAHLFFRFSIGSTTFNPMPANGVYYVWIFKTASALYTTGIIRRSAATDIYVIYKNGDGGWNVQAILYGNGWLPNNTDLDDIVTPGTYGLNATNSYTHSPGAGVGGVMEVFLPASGTTYCIQRVTTVGLIYIRYKNQTSGTAFSGWYKYTGTAV